MRISTSILTFPSLFLRGRWRAADHFLICILAVRRCVIKKIYANISVSILIFSFLRGRWRTADLFPLWRAACHRPPAHPPRGARPRHSPLHAEAGANRWQINNLSPFPAADPCRRLAGGPPGSSSPARLQQHPSLFPPAPAAPSVSRISQRRFARPLYGDHSSGLVVSDVAAAATAAVATVRRLSPSRWCPSFTGGPHHRLRV
jgi:hypothetical protein